MTVKKNNVRALGLLSGGLDSTLALHIIHRQGIDIQAIHFSTGFCTADASARVRRPEDVDTMQGGPGDAFSVADKLGIPIKLINVSDGYLEVLHNPRFGYGKNVNPCVDCRIYMFSIAKWLMEEHDADFVFTGEVLGQRPKSQHLTQLNTIAKQSGLADRVLRPLSARLLPPTLPEREGWVNREKLFGFHGRTRKPQMELAAEFGVGNYPQPAGGCCVLTDPAFARKVEDMWQNHGKEEMSWEDYLLLKIGRHLRVARNGGESSQESAKSLKVVVGRNEGENLFLENYRKGRLKIEVEDAPGPVVLVDDDTDEAGQLQAARIAARYCSARETEGELTVRIENGAHIRHVKVTPYKPEEVEQWVIR